MIRSRLQQIADMSRKLNRVWLTRPELSLVELTTAVSIAGEDDGEIEDILDSVLKKGGHKQEEST